MSTTLSTTTRTLSPRKAVKPGGTDGDRNPTSLLTARAHSPKARSYSDAPKPSLSPSPAFREPARRVSKDDSVIPAPTTPKRPNVHTRGLSLQMPGQDIASSASALSTSRGPLSPKLDASHTYNSPTSMLPRRSRGLDFTRACTNLHHSTLAASSPEASPTIGGRGIQIPQRRGLGGKTVLDSPSNLSSSLWSSMPGADKTGLSSSVSSVNMLDSDSDSGSSSDDMAIDREIDDPLLNTPAVTKLQNILSSPAGDSLSAFTSLGQSNFYNFTRARMRGGGKKSRHSSSSVSASSAKPSPGALSPRVVQSIENSNAGYFAPGLTRQQVQSRRESLSLGAGLLHLSDSEDNEGKSNKRQSLSSTMDISAADGPRGVVRRAVTRRSNMLPKTKTFARIRAALMEEAAPIDSEVRREAEVIRQVHDNDPTYKSDPSPILPATPFTQEPEASPEEGDSAQENHSRSQNLVPTESFSRHAERNSAGLGFWNAFDERYRTPPPPTIPRESSTTLSDEAMDTTGSAIVSTIENAAWMHLNRSRSRSITPMPSNPPSAGDVARKVNNKRRRDGDFDPAASKRRAVSPGMSAQSSPILPQSPVLNGEKTWTRAPAKQPDRSNSGSSVNGGTRKVGLQGMTETSDGMMNMSID